MLTKKTTAKKIVAPEKIGDMSADPAYLSAIESGRRYLESKSWASAQISFEQAMAVKGHEDDQSAKEGLAKAREERFKFGGGFKPPPRHDPATGKFLIFDDSSKDWKESTPGEFYNFVMEYGMRWLETKIGPLGEIFFIKALTVKGYENDPAAKLGLAKAREAMANGGMPTPPFPTNSQFPISPPFPGGRHGDMKLQPESIRSTTMKSVNGK
jgi:hypothetical protein